MTSVPRKPVSRPPRPAQPCDHWNGTTRIRCCSTVDVRFYLIGWRCPAHTPAAERAAHQ